jgi:hypothetical protein
VTGEILDVVLPFSVGMIRWLSHDSRSTLSCVLAVAMNILHSNHDVSTGFISAAWLHQHDGSISNVQLRAMTSHSNPKRESEHVAKPFRGLLHVGIDKLGNYGASGDRSIR